MIDDDEPVHVVPYDPAWQELGRELVRQISDELRELQVHVTHIGSTSVPGLCAKPVVDIQVGCPPGDVEEVVARMRGIGFEHLGRTGGPGREYLRRRTGRSANIAVVELHGRLWADNIRFRDHLRTHPEAADRYARAKLLAAAETGALRGYSAHKASTVEEIMREARTDTAGPTGPEHPAGPAALSRRRLRPRLWSFLRGGGA